MNIIGWIIFFFAGLRLGISFFNRISGLHLPEYVPEPSRRLPATEGTKKEVPYLSVLIPARNEEANLPRLLGDLERLGCDDLEIIIYDDGSSDNTAKIAEEAARRRSCFRLIRGQGPEAGWTGKNYACHRLGNAARGKTLLFLDADVRIDSDIPARAVRYLYENRLQLLSIFPRQIMTGPGTRMAVPLMNWILLTLLPLPLIRTAPHKSLAAANGQFMMFEAAAYRSTLPHRACRRDPVEDIAIVRLYKERNLKAATLLGTDGLSCRMYGTLKEAVEGFSKNIFRFFGGHAALAVLFALTTTAGLPWIYFFNGPVPALVYLTVIVLIRIFVSLASRQSVFLNLLLMIPQQGVLWLIIFKAFRNRLHRETLWKGRNIYPETSGKDKRANGF